MLFNYQNKPYYGIKADIDDWVHHAVAESKDDSCHLQVSPDLLFIYFFLVIITVCLHCISYDIQHIEWNRRDKEQHHTQHKRLQKTKSHCFVPEYALLLGIG